MPNEIRDQPEAVYVMCNKSNRVLYTGVTSDLLARVFEHRWQRDPDAFTSRHRVTELVNFELTGSITAAIERERQIKAGSRVKTVALIEAANPEWRDLAAEW